MAIGKVIKGDGSAEPAAPDRAQHNRPRPGAVVNAEVFDAQQTAKGILEDAKRHRDEILAAARAQADRLIEEFKEEGRKQGKAELAELLIRARLHHRQVVAASEKEVVKLALKVAEKIIGRDVERDPRVLAEIVALAVDTVRSVKELTLRVNPKDAAILREHKKHLLELIGRVKEIAIKEDAEVGRGGCVIETEIGIVDAQLANQLELLQQLLLGYEGKKEGPA